MCPPLSCLLPEGGPWQAVTLLPVAIAAMLLPERGWGFAQALALEAQPPQHPSNWRFRPPKITFTDVSPARHKSPPAARKRTSLPPMVPVHWMPGPS